MRFELLLFHLLKQVAAQQQQIFRLQFLLQLVLVVAVVNPSVHQDQILNQAQRCRLQ